MPKYNVIDYSDNYSKTEGCFCWYYRYEAALNAKGAIIDFAADSNNDAFFKFKTKIACRTGNDGTKDVKIIVA